MPDERRWRRLAALTALTVAAGCSDGPAGPRPVDPPDPGPAEPAAVLREFRGMWIATVANIDWPSAAALPVAQQRAELVALLDLAQSLRLNGVFLQVRAAGDALYPSPHEPWSAVLAGAQGTDPGWDPLAFAVTEAHGRGLELHAWFNPFRAGNASDTLRLHAQHLARRRPDLARVVRGSLWFDPGEAEVHDHALRVIRDVVARYDIDGVHLDDFFYPYPTTGTTIPVPFPDSATYARYAAGAGTSALGILDWRRDNVNRFVERVYREVKQANGQLKVGISPFGIWRPGNPPGITGLDAWRDIYADSRLWLQRGWVDYLAPQLYWSMASTGQNFPALHAWWLEQNTLQRHLWPGLAAYRVADGSASAYAADEIANQIALTRSRAGATAGGGSGTLLYNATSLRRDRGGLATLLRTTTMKDLAVPPPFPWMDASPPARPVLTVTSGTIRFDVPGEVPRWWLVHQRRNGTWESRIVPGSSNTVATNTGGPDALRVAAIDRASNLSEVARWP